MTAKMISVLFAVVFIAVITTVGAVLWCSSAAAQQPGQFDRRRPPFDREEMLKRFDTDGDGELSEEERRAMQ